MTISVSTAEEAWANLPSTVRTRPIRLATTGYSRPPEGYAESTRQFLSQLCRELADQLALVTSPTATPGSIDQLSTEAAEALGLPLGYLTAEEFVRFAPASLPRPVLVLPDAAEYSRATAALSTCLLVAGGRQAALSDFRHAREKGHRVVVLRSERPAEKDGEVEDAGMWLARQPEDGVLVTDDPLEAARFLAT